MAEMDEKYRVIVEALRQIANGKTRLLDMPAIARAALKRAEESA